MGTTNQIRRSYQDDQSACIIACHGIITKLKLANGGKFKTRM